MLDQSFRGSLFSASGLLSPALGAGGTGFPVVQGSVAFICLPSGLLEAFGCACPCPLCLAAQAALCLNWFTLTNRPYQDRLEQRWPRSLVSLTNLHFTLDVDPLPTLASEDNAMLSTFTTVWEGTSTDQTEKQAACRLIIKGCLVHSSSFPEYSAPVVSSPVLLLQPIQRDWIP